MATNKTFLLTAFFLLQTACVDERLDTSVYDRSCAVDDDCWGFTSACLQADNQCPTFVANADEATHIDEDRADLMCTGPKTMTQVDCEYRPTTCDDGTCRFARESDYNEEPQPDSGVSQPDSGVSQPDGGVQRSDAGVRRSDAGVRLCEGEPVDGEEGSPCGLNPQDCSEGLLCDVGCTDDLDECSGRCRPANQPDAFCRQGSCEDGGQCDEFEVCREDGFCYPDMF